MMLYKVEEKQFGYGCNFMGEHTYHFCEPRIMRSEKVCVCNLNIFIDRIYNDNKYIYI